MPDFRISLVDNQKPLLIVEAATKPQAFERGVAVSGSLPRPVPDGDENWTIKRHRGPYNSSVPFFSARFFDLGLDRLPVLPD